MKTTVEIPDRVFRAAKAAAAGRGVSLRTYLTEALEEKLGTRSLRKSGWPVPPPNLVEGTMKRLRGVVETEFSRIDPEGWK